MTPGTGGVLDAPCRSGKKCVGGVDEAAHFHRPGTPTASIILYGTEGIAGGAEVPAVVRERKSAVTGAFVTDSDERPSGRQTTLCRRMMQRSRSTRSAWRT